MDPVVIDDVVAADKWTGGDKRREFKVSLKTDKV
jgi:hypothetical protein